MARSTRQTKIPSGRCERKRIEVREAREPKTPTIYVITNNKGRGDKAQSLFRGLFATMLLLQQFYTIDLAREI